MRMEEVSTRMGSMPAERTDAELARAWAAGDERAYDDIVTRFAPLVFGHCRRALGATDADDATQAVFLILARKREQAAASPILAAWLMTVAGNVVRNARRDRQRRRSAETSVPLPISATEEPVMPGIQEHLDACLNELPTKERDAVMLHHLAGHTLAEVSRQTGSGMSTVRYRIERGLERLRALLAKRGVVMGSIALATALASEAQAAVPGEVLVHLHDLRTAGGVTAATPDRVHRWSRLQPSTRKHIALVAAGMLFLAVLAWQFLSSAEAAAPPKGIPAVSVEVPKTTRSATGDPVHDLDPEFARTWIVLRVNDGVRTVSRLRTQPEMVLLPPALRGWLDDLATLRDAVLVIDKDSLLPDAERIRSYRTWQEMAGMNRAQQEERARAELRREVARRLDDDPSPSVPRLAAFTGWITATSAEAPLLARLRAILDDPPSPAGVKALGGGIWTCASVAGDERICITGERLTVVPPTTANRVPPLISDLAAGAVEPDAELEFAAYLDPGRPGLTPVRTATGSLRISVDGLRFSSNVDTGRDAPAAPILNRQCFARVPAAAICAGAIALHPGDTGPAGFYRSLLASTTEGLQAKNNGRMPPEAKAILDALGLLLDRVDGVIIGWIEPGMPLPIMTIEVDLAKTDADAVIAATGLTRQTDGAAMVWAGPIMFSLGWQDGHLIVTTNPAGLAGINRSGGFTTQPEIQRALAALPSSSINACALLRPAATLDLAIPFGVMLVPDLQKPLIDYRTALANGQCYGFMTSGTSGRTNTIEAGGILALVGCAMLSAQATDPAVRLRIAN